MSTVYVKESSLSVKLCCYKEEMQQTMINFQSISKRHSVSLFILSLLSLDMVSMSYICRYPGTGEYDKFFEEGVYNCAGCGTPLYKSTTKFNSGCGWPAFYEGLPGAINSTVSTHSSSFLSYLCDFLNIELAI